VTDRTVHTMSETPEPQSKRRCLVDRMMDTLDAVEAETLDQTLTHEKHVVHEFLRARHNMRLRWTESLYCDAHDFLGLSFSIGEYQEPRSDTVQLRLVSTTDRRYVYLRFAKSNDDSVVLCTLGPLTIRSMGRTLQLYSVTLSVQSILACMEQPARVRSMWDKLGLSLDVFTNVLMPYLDPVEGLCVNYSFSW